MNPNPYKNKNDNPNQWTPENGPPPAKNLKKRQHGANILYEEYQSEYDERAKQQNNKVKEVHEHNKYPKLNNELHKKMSIIKVTTIKSNRVSYPYDLNCPACAKLMTIRELKRQKIKKRCTQRDPRIKDEPARESRSKIKLKIPKRAHHLRKKKHLRHHRRAEFKKVPSSRGDRSSKTSPTSFLSFASADNQPME